MLTTLTIAVAAEPTRGWGGPAAILIAVAIFITYATLLDWWQRRRDLPSPTEGDDTDTGVNAQVRADSDSDDSGDEPVREHEWGSVSGSSNRVEVVIKRKVDPGPQSDTRSDLDRWLTERVDRWRTTDIVQEGAQLHRVSESTIMRAIRRVRADRVGEERQ